MIWLIVNGVLLFIELINCLLHGVGAYLLSCLYKKDRKDSQKLYVLNLACSELVLNILLVIRETIVMLYKSGYAPTHLLVVFRSIDMALGTGVLNIYMLAMFYLTADRLLQTILLLKYPQYWTLGKSKTLIIVTWVLNIAIGVTFSLLTYFKMAAVVKFKIHMIMLVYTPTCVYCVYLAFAIVTYLRMFMVFAHSKRRLSRRDDNGKQVSLYKHFTNSRFFLSVTLIGSYLVLTVIPSIVRAIWYLTSPESLPITLFICIAILKTLSLTVDAIIYIFLQKNVLKLLKQKMGFDRKKEENGYIIHRKRGGTKETIEAVEEANQLLKDGFEMVERKQL